MKKTFGIALVLVILVFCVAFPATAAWGTFYYNPAPFPTPEWAQNVLVDQVATRIDHTLGAKFHFVQQAQDGSLVVHGNGGTSYTAYLQVNEQAAGTAAWQGNFTQVTGFVSSNKGYFQVFGVKAPNKPMDLNVFPMQSGNGWFSAPCPPPFFN